VVPGRRMGKWSRWHPERKLKHAWWLETNTNILINGMTGILISGNLQG
jgi:hypothetical protein